MSTCFNQILLESLRKRNLCLLWTPLLKMLNLLPAYSRTLELDSNPPHSMPGQVEVSPYDHAYKVPGDNHVPCTAPEPRADRKSVV